MSENNTSTHEEQLLYADILNKGMLVGLLILFITFALYMLEVLEPAIPHEQVSQYWSQPVHEYLHAINHNFLKLEHPPTGWTWLTLLGFSDFLNFIGIAVLSGITMLCYASIVPILLKKGDKIYAIIATLEVLILALAASGILAVGH